MVYDDKINNQSIQELFKVQTHRRLWRTNRNYTVVALN